MRQREVTWWVLGLVTACLGICLARAQQERDVAWLEGSQGEGASGRRPLDAIGVLHNPFVETRDR